MAYAATLQRTEQGTFLEFPEIPGLSVSVPDPRDAVEIAHEALNERIEAMLSRGELPQRPWKLHEPNGDGRIMVPLRPDHAVALQMRWMRQEQGLTLTEVAERMGVSRQRISALETTARNWTVATLQRLSEAFDSELEIVFKKRRR